MLFIIFSITFLTFLIRLNILQINLMKSSQELIYSNILAVDIGGTLTKVALSCQQTISQQIFTTLKHAKVYHLEIKSSKFSKDQKLSLIMVFFQQKSQFFDFLQNSILKNLHNLKIVATGGGSLKYKYKFQSLKTKAQSENKSLQFKVKMNEFQTIISAIQLLLDSEAEIKLQKDKILSSKLLIEGITTDSQQKLSKKLQSPLILANIGSGMSVLKFQQNNQGVLEFTRVGGSALGGGFLLGLQKIYDKDFSYERFSSNFLSNLENKILQDCVLNMSQIIGLYSDIFSIKNILITGGMVKANSLKEKLIKNLQSKNVFFTQIDGLLSVIGILFSEWKNAAYKNQ